MKTFSKPIVSLIVACMILLPFSAQAGMIRGAGAQGFESCLC